MANRPTYLQGEDIEFYVDIDKKYLTDYERLFAYAYFDKDHHLLTSTEGEFIQMTPDVENSRVKIHIANAVSANPDIMPVGIWTLEIMTVYNGSEYRAIYQNLKQFEIKRSFIVFSGDVFINQNIKMAIQQLNHYRGETITFRFTGDGTYTFEGSNQGENNPFFIVFVYPDGINVSDTAEQTKVKKIKSTVTEQTQGEDGYVNFIERENEVQCILPYETTQDMNAGKYTIELRYGKIMVSVIKRNTAFTMVDAASQEDNLINN